MPGLTLASRNHRDFPLTLGAFCIRTRCERLLKPSAPLPQAASLAMAVATSLGSRKPGTSFTRSTDPITTETVPKRPSTRATSGVLTP